MKFKLSIIKDSEMNYKNLNLDPIDCESDPCHLAWLVRDNRQLLKVIPNADCEWKAVLTPLERLDLNIFNNCATVTYLI